MAIATAKIETRRLERAASALSLAAGGAVLSIFCDARIMAEGDFRIGLNEVQVGLSLPQVIHTALVRVVGCRQAERLGVGGLLVPAGEALRIGLVDELVPVEAVVERALERCRDFLKLPPRAMATTRALCRLTRQHNRHLNQTTLQSPPLTNQTRVRAVPRSKLQAGTSITLAIPNNPKLCKKLPTF